MKEAACPNGCPLRLADAPPLVLIPLADYVSLINTKLKAEVNSLSFKQLSKPARSTVDRNQEVCMFITMRLGLKAVREIHLECRKRFGSSRTPSAKSIYRYWERLRIAARSGS